MNKRIGVQVIFIILIGLSIYQQWQWMGMALLGITLILGSIFCGYICPMGTLQDMMQKLALKLKIKQLSLSPKLHRRMILIRYILFMSIVYLGISFLMGLTAFDPRTNLFLWMTNKVVTVTLVMSVLITLSMSLFYTRPFCNYFCIKGAEYGLISSVRLFRVTRHVGTCIDCGRCNKACPMHIDIQNHAVVHSLQCTTCMACKKACPVQGTLCLSGPNKWRHKFVGFRGLKSKIDKKYMGVLGLIGLGLLLLSLNQGETFPQYINTQAVLKGDQIVKQNTAANIANGTYKGTGNGFNGPIEVEVKVKEAAIEKITVLKSTDDQQWFNHAEQNLSKAMIENQSTNVDVASGATYSSQGYINAVKNALGQEDYVKVVSASKGHHHHDD